MNLSGCLFIIYLPHVSRIYVKTIMAFIVWMTPSTFLTVYSEKSKCFISEQNSINYLDGSKASFTPSSGCKKIIWERYCTKTWIWTQSSEKSQKEWSIKTTMFKTYAHLHHLLSALWCLLGGYLIHSFQSSRFLQNQ